jgi:hypothetical protein
MAEILLDEIAEAHCLSIVDEVFALFESWTHELLCHATKESHSANHRCEETIALSSCQSFQFNR